uniref:Uncharacterized protein n=1 Tax=Anguilla anguilla TaxID=7936 RepID=A0A0E9TBB8_ANGAN
MSYVMHLS